MTRPSLDRTLNRLRLIALVAGLLGVALCVVGAVLDHQQFFRAYLLGYVFWWRLAIGCLALALLYQMTGGAWGIATRAFFDSGVGTLPLVAVLFVPLAFGLDSIYPWTASDYFADIPHAENRELYLSKTFFLARSAGYFVIWLLYGWLLSGSPLRSYTRREQLAARTMGLFSGGGMVLLVLSVTFAAIDWLMTLDPLWYSTIFGGLIAVGALLSAMALVLASTALLIGHPAAGETRAPELLNDLGNLMLAFLMVWTYFSFSQFLIIWSGNLPEEVAWYADRLQYGWDWVVLFLAVFHFVVPFVCLLSRDVKRNPRALGAVALWILFMQLVDLYWLIVPTFHTRGFYLHWLYVAAPLAVGGLWLTAYAWQLQHRLLPVAHFVAAEAAPREDTHG